MLVLLAVAVPTIALSVNETSRVPFGPAWAEAWRIGVRATTLSLDWSGVETRPGEYDLALPRIAEAFYPKEGAEVGLVLRDLNTNRDERPSELRGKAYDDSEALRRWEGMADAVLGAMPHLRLSWIAVGNEVDAHLKGDAVAGYARFLRAAFAHLRRVRPGVRLGTTLTFEGVRDRAEALRPILDAGDVAMVDYYLIDAARRPAREQVPKDLDAMARFAGRRPLLLTEAGAPSGTACGSSEAAQAALVGTLVAEARRRSIPYVALQWMNDIGKGAAQGFGGYYGVRDAAFLDYLATLGLRHEDGSPKPVWATLASAFGG